MKQKIFLYLIIAMIAFSIPAFADTYIFPDDPAPVVSDELTMEQALAIAQNEMMQRESLSEINPENYRIKANCVWLENGEKAWVVLLASDFNVDAAITISAYGGHVIHYQNSYNDIYTDMGECWIKQKGPIGEWPMEEQALFRWLYGSSERYLVPDENMISQKQAEEIAMTYYGKNIPSLTTSASFSCNIFTDGRPDQYIWMVNIRENGREVLVVHVDANTGEIVETFGIGLG